MPNGTNANTEGSLVAKKDFQRRRPNDSISDLQMAEITERLIISLGLDPARGVVQGENPPEDTGVIWITTDAEGRNFGIRFFNTLSGEWIDPLALIAEQRQSYTETYAIPSNDATKSFTHGLVGENIIYTVTPKGAPGADFRWYEEDKTSDELQLHFLDGNGLSVEVVIQHKLPQV